MKGLQRVCDSMTDIRNAMNRVLLGQDNVLEQVLTCFVAGGHVLVEGVPGVGKTLLSKTLAKLVNAGYRRIQFTPDLLPSDIVGTNVFDARNTQFSLRKGPIFTEILFADEVNRTPPKTQAALLEAMEERQVTIEGVRYPLPDLFFVIATQNPVEYEGTYPLPETQLDRFMMKVTIDYPPPEAELALIRSYAEGTELPDLSAFLTGPLIEGTDVLSFRKDLPGIVVTEGIVDYIRRIIAETRDPVYVQLGASPRAAIAVLKTSRALAALRGREFVTPDEVKEVTIPALCHRVILRPDALLDGLTPNYFLENILKRVPVPR